MKIVFQLSIFIFNWLDNFYNLPILASKSSWESIVSKTTGIATTVGVSHAGEPCKESGYSFKVCLKTTSSGEQVQSPLLQCNQLNGGTFVETEVCQVKTWIVLLILTLVIGIFTILTFNLICCIWTCWLRKVRVRPFNVNINNPTT